MGAGRPAAGQACSGYLIEHQGFRLLVDPGYAVLPRLLERVAAEDVDAVLISHGHPDHCADLHPLVRARALAPDPPRAVPVYALPEAVDAVMALDRPGALDHAYVQHDFTAGDRLEIGPFQLDTWLLPHFVPNAGIRLTVDGRTVAYTGDTGPSEDLVTMAGDADVFLAEATYPEIVPERYKGMLSTARQAGRYAARAGVGRLLLTHLWPGTPAAAARDAACKEFSGPVEVASEGLVIDLG